MRVLVDTSIWSAAQQRGKQVPSAEVDELGNLVLDHRAEISDKDFGHFARHIPIVVHRW